MRLILKARFLFKPISLYFPNDLRRSVERSRQCKSVADHTQDSLQRAYLDVVIVVFQGTLSRMLRFSFTN